MESNIDGHLLRGTILHRLQKAVMGSILKKDDVMNAKRNIHNFSQRCLRLSESNAGSFVMILFERIERRSYYKSAKRLRKEMYLRF